MRAAIVVVFVMLTFCQTADAFMARNACTEDMLKFCSGAGDRSQRSACLKANLSKLSPDCRAMFKGK